MKHFAKDTRISKKFAAAGPRHGFSAISVSLAWQIGFAKHAEA
jgi:hypothetical protein